MTVNGIGCIHLVRNATLVVHSQADVHRGVGPRLCAVQRHHRRRIVVDRSRVDVDVVDAEVPAVTAHCLEDDEAVAFRTVEGVVVFVPVADVTNHRLEHGVAVNCAEQGAISDVGGRGVVNIDSIRTHDVIVVVTENPITNSVVGGAELQFG